MGGHGRIPFAALAALALVLGASALEAGRGHFERRARKKGWEYPKLTRYTFIEDSKDYGRLTLAANVELAMFRLQDPYLPVIFVLASERNPPLRLHPDRFRLLLPDGSVQAPVPYHVLLEEGYKTELVHDWARRRGISPTHGYFTTGYRRVESTFYPDPSGRAARGVLLDSVELTADTWGEDVLYFRNPGGLAGTELRLRYEDPDSGPGKDVARWIEVVFVVPDPWAGAAKGSEGRSSGAP